MKVVLIGLVTSVCLAGSACAEGVAGPGIRFDPSTWKTDERALDLSVRNYSFQRFDNKKPASQEGARYSSGPKLIGAFSIAIYWVSGEEGLREAILSRRSGKVLFGVRHAF